MTILEDLYYGNIVPADKGIRRGSEYSKLLNLSVRNEENLIPTLSKEQKVIFEKYKDCVIEINSISEKEAFVEGMKLGIKIIAETYIGNSHSFDEI